MRRLTTGSKSNALNDPQAGSPCRIPWRTAEPACRCTMPFMYTMAIVLAMRVRPACSTQTRRPSPAKIAQTRSQMTLGKAAEMSKRVVPNVVSPSVKAFSVAEGLKILLFHT